MTAADACRSPLAGSTTTAPCTMFIPQVAWCAFLGPKKNQPSKTMAAIVGDRARGPVNGEQDRAPMAAASVRGQAVAPEGAGQNEPGDQDG